MHTANRNFRYGSILIFPGFLFWGTCPPRPSSGPTPDQNWMTCHSWRTGGDRAMCGTGRAPVVAVQRFVGVWSPRHCGLRADERTDGTAEAASSRDDGR